MKIEFEFDMADWMAFQKDYMRHSKEFKRSKIFTTLVGPVVFAMLCIIDRDFRYSTLMAFGVFSGLFILFCPKLFDRYTLKKSEKMINEGDNSGILGRHETVFDVDGIIHREPESESKLKWSRIKKLSETDDYYFLYNSTFTAIVIPKRKIGGDLQAVDKVIKDNVFLRI